MLQKMGGGLNLYEEVKIYTTDIAPLVLEKQKSPYYEKEFSILVIEDNEDLRNVLFERNLLILLTSKRPSKT